MKVDVEQNLAVFFYIAFYRKFILKYFLEVL